MLKVILFSKVLKLLAAVDHLRNSLSCKYGLHVFDNAQCRHAGKQRYLWILPPLVSCAGYCQGPFWLFYLTLQTSFILCFHIIYVISLSILVFDLNIRYGKINKKTTSEKKDMFLTFWSMSVLIPGQYTAVLVRLLHFVCRDFPRTAFSSLLLLSAE